ncbi:pilus assembly protein TadG-related protein [Catellatospora sp. KI3]|uniref:TadE/TadG family type IV pilus assembly protein n=1 Tax=Catellatospora sp. KI3 TaxID=3041620 RepID=UPI0024821790|nr:TadE/TadG family type IV pilus assembly protein [Catellatospora sp. KI3]MDI1461706.1 pilus assembly protein TadG-related protein [Catellatospora sp. KI3]
MPGLNPRGRRRDAGGVSTIVAIVLAGGVLLGMSALVVDVGQIYAEREELQSGADAAAMKVALDCARHRTACGSTARTGAELISDANAKDGRSSILELCGRDAGGRLSRCTLPDSGGLVDCIGSAPASGDYVQVRTRTEVAADDYVLPFTFAQTLTGVGAGTTVGACARVAYGPPKGGLAVTISRNEYECAMAAGTVAAPPWPPNPSATREVVLGVHGGAARTCYTGGPPSGWDVPGGFGWLDEDAGPCRFLLGADLDYDGDSGTSASRDCKTALADLRTSHQVIALPIYDGERGRGSNAQYHLYRLGAFVVTGYSVPGLHEASNVNPSFDPCRGTDKCIYGYFVDVEFLPGDVGPDPGTDLGLAVVKTIG